MPNAAFIPTGAAHHPATRSLLHTARTPLPHHRTTYTAQPHPTWRRSRAVPTLPLATILPPHATLATLATLPPCRHLALALALPPASPTTVTALLLISAALGLLSTRTRAGSALSAPLVTALLTLLLSNLTLLPPRHPAYTFVTSQIVPLAVPLLLFDADLNRVLRDTGPLLLCFILGTLATLLGTLIAFHLIPLTPILGADAWKIAAALCARHIGGAVNYVATAQAAGATSSSIATALAADNLIVALYFMLLLLLARGLAQPPARSRGRALRGVGGNSAPVEALGGEDASLEDAGITTLDLAVALAIAATLVAIGTFVNACLPFNLGAIPVTTALVLVLATARPDLLRRYRPAANGVGIFFMQIFFAVTGAGGSIAGVLRDAPRLFLFSSVQLAVHLVVVLVVGRLARLHLAELLLASNANVGGPTTAAGMAAAKGWDRLVVPALLVGVFGYSIATFLSLGLGHFFLKPS